MALQLDAICSEVSDHDIRDAIKSLPPDLTTTYARVLEKSAAKDPLKYHNRIFKFLAAAYEPLTSAQICEMASVTIGNKTYDPRRQINNIDKVLGFCGSLIMVDEEEKTVRFIHHSARSFCQGPRVEDSFDQFTEEEAHNELGGTILTYLNFSIFKNSISTTVIPEIDTGKVLTGIIRQTLHDSQGPVRVVGNLFNWKISRGHQIGHILAQNMEGFGLNNTVISTHPFLLYARNYWLLHTRYGIEPSVRSFWTNMINELDLTNLRPLPSVIATWGAINVPRVQDLLPGMLWSIQNPHLSLFNHVMGQHTSSFRLQSLRVMALLRIFKAFSALPLLSRHYDTFPGPGVESHMASRLLPISEFLNTFRVSEWLASQIESSFGSSISQSNEIPSAHTIAAHGRFQTHGEKPGMFELDATDTQVARVGDFITGLRSDTPRTYKLLPRRPEWNSFRSQIPIAQALLSTLQSNAPHAIVLRVCCSLLQKGPSMRFLGTLPIYSILKLLMESKDLNRTVADGIMEGLLNDVRSLGLEIHVEIFRRACLMGNLDLATWQPMFNSNLIRPSHKGDEISLVLQTISKERVELAVWLLGMGASPNCTDASGYPVLHRAALLRNWFLARTLVHHGASTQGLLELCSRKELLHFCIMNADLDGIKFLAWAGCVTGLNVLSPGPEFAHFAPIHVAAFTYSDWCQVHPLSILMAEGARVQSATTGDILLGIEETLEAFVISHERDAGRDIDVLQNLKRHFDTDFPAFEISSKMMCLVAVATRQLVHTHLFDLPDKFKIWPSLKHKEFYDLKVVLGCLSNSLLLLSRFFRNPPAPGFQQADLILAFRDMMGALSCLKPADFDDLHESLSLQRQVSLSLPIWKIQMRLLQIIDLFLRNDIPLHLEGSPRGTGVIPDIEILCTDLLYTSTACKPTVLDGDSAGSTNRFAEQFEHF